MHTLLAIAAGVMFASGLYMMFRRSFVKLIIGLVLIGHAANIVIFTSGGLVRGAPALIPAGEARLPDDPAFTDPLPPALILTAIVISFAIISYTIVLVRRAYQAIGTDDLDQMRSTDK
ncbi:MAG: Na+/H+ antiporter subunit C [Phycisphaerales bacterium]|nr:MAG: Na+/H+ antiporter subunit C [Phycisphaerales bacterium]